MNKSDWVWMPHAAHFCGGHRCNFRLTTYVGGFIVSTVGELWREVEHLRDRNWSEVSPGRNYETMVFLASENDPGCGCPFVIKGGREMEVLRTNDPEEARQNHLRLCEEWSDKELADEVMVLNQSEGAEW